MKFAAAAWLCGVVAAQAADPAAVCGAQTSRAECAKAIANKIVVQSRQCFEQHSNDEVAYKECAGAFCSKQCGSGSGSSSCRTLCVDHAAPLFARFAVKLPASNDSEASNPLNRMNRAQLQAQMKEAESEQEAAMADLQKAQGQMRHLDSKLAAHAQMEIRNGSVERGKAEMARVEQLSKMEEQIDAHLDKVATFKGMAARGAEAPAAKASSPSFLQRASKSQRSKPEEEELAKEMTHDLEMNFNKIAPFGKEDTAKELQDHAAKTQDTLVDAVENAEVAEIKRAVFRALTRLRAATIKEFDTIARLETQAIDAYNDAHHYRAENPLAHLHEDEAPVETDKLKSFH